MSFLVILIGLLIFGIGVGILFSPATLRQILNNFLLKKWLVPATLLRIFIGIIFLIAAPSTRWPIFIHILGIVFILAGVSIPLLGTEKIERLANWWMERSDAILRVWAAIAAVLGIAILWAG